MSPRSVASSLCSLVDEGCWMKMHTTNIKENETSTWYDVAPALDGWYKMPKQQCIWYIPIHVSLWVSTSASCKPYMGSAAFYFDRARPPGLFSSGTHTATLVEEQQALWASCIMYHVYICSEMLSWTTQPQTLLLKDTRGKVMRALYGCLEYFHNLWVMTLQQT